MSETFLKILEIAGLVFGVLYLVGVRYEKGWCWPMGILAVVCYGVSMFYGEMYGEFSVQILYFFLSIYGWFKWQFNIQDNLKITENSSFQLIRDLGVGVLISVMFYYLLLWLHGQFPFWDAITSGFAIIATYWVAKKKIENWLLWIPVDATLAIVMFMRGFPFYGCLYVFYTLYVIYGYFEWKKEMNHAK